MMQRSCLALMQAQPEEVNKQLIAMALGIGENNGQYVRIE
jgi:hypothetical protein